MRILVTNDDGIESPGIKALAAALVADDHEVMVFAPSTDRSGAGAAIGKLHGAAPPTVVRANVPIDEVKGVREAALAAHGEVWIASADVSGGDLKLEFKGLGEATPGTDVALIRDGFVAVTPLVGIARARPRGTQSAADAIATERILSEQPGTSVRRSDERSAPALDSPVLAVDTRRNAMT